MLCMHERQSDTDDRVAANAAGPEAKQYRHPGTLTLNKRLSRGRLCSEPHASWRAQPYREDPVSRAQHAQHVPSQPTCPPRSHLCRIPPSTSLARRINRFGLSGVILFRTAALHRGHSVSCCAAVLSVCKALWMPTPTGVHTLCCVRQGAVRTVRLGRSARTPL